MRKVLSLLCMALLICTTACERQSYDTDSHPDSRLTARQLFEHQKSQLPQTKSSDFSDLIRPMPGDFVVRWDDAVEYHSADITAVTVPISALTSYTAIFPCESHSAAEHQHSPVTVIQKLVVMITPDSSACYIVNIVPFEECDLTEADLSTGFGYGVGMDGFYGFAAYHQFNGDLSHIEQFVDGHTGDVALPADTALMSEITRNVRLYLNHSRSVTAAYEYKPEGWPGDELCDLCHRYCGSEYLYSLDNSTIGFDIYKYNRDNRDKHCLVCSKLKSHCTCLTGGGGAGGSANCPTCGLPNCTASHNSWDCAFCGVECANRVDPRATPEIVHGQFIKDLLRDKISATDLHNLQVGIYYADKSRTSSGDEYLHNLKPFNENYLVGYSKIRSHFVNLVKWYKNYNYIQRLGEAMHPILDWYISLDKRNDMLDYYAYPACGNVAGIARFDNKTRDIMTIFDSIFRLPQYPTDEQVGAIFDKWDSEY